MTKVMTLLALFAILLPHALPQKATTAAKPVGTALLTGKVFAITKGGDVKPALLAHVYLFLSGATVLNPSSWTPVIEGQNGLKIPNVYACF